MQTTQRKPKQGRLTLNRQVWDALFSARELRSLRDQARYIGVAHSQVSRVLAGATCPGADFIAAAVANLGVSCDDLFTVTVR